MNPLVSVVCLCYNHEKFVRDAINSVLNQTYPNIEVIVLDDASTDGSVSIIEQIKRDHPGIIFLQLKENIGNCAAFNKGLAMVHGEFVIDFATDDVMLPERLEKQVNHFRQLDASYGVSFTNANYVNASGKTIRNHTDHLLGKKLVSKIPEGWVFRDVLRRYFICSPTMLVRKVVFDKLNGYDENLVYEDFDFWVRASRNFKFAYLDEVLTNVTRSHSSMSSGWYEPGDKQLHSTFLVCQKAIDLCEDEGDKQALLTRVRYEFRQAVFSGNKVEAKLFAGLDEKLEGHNWQFYLFTFLTWLPLPWPWIRKKYHQLFYG